MYSKLFSLLIEAYNLHLSFQGSKKIVREHCLVIKTKKQTKYILQAPTEDEMKDWFQIIHNLIQKYKL